MRGRVPGPASLGAWLTVGAQCVQYVLSLGAGTITPIAVGVIVPCSHYLSQCF